MQATHALGDTLNSYMLNSQRRVGDSFIKAHQVDADTQQHHDQTSPASKDQRKLADACSNAFLTKSSRENCISEELSKARARDAAAAVCIHQSNLF